jgi:hypothetical protein
MQEGIMECHAECGKVAGMSGESWAAGKYAQDKECLFLLKLSPAVCSGNIFPFVALSLCTHLQYGHFGTL